VLSRSLKHFRQENAGLVYSVEVFTVPPEVSCLNLVFFCVFMMLAITLVASWRALLKQCMGNARVVVVVGG